MKVRHNVQDVNLDIIYNKENVNLIMEHLSQIVNQLSLALHVSSVNKIIWLTHLINVLVLEASAVMFLIAIIVNPQITVHSVT